MCSNFEYTFLSRFEVRSPENIKKPSSNYQTIGADQGSEGVKCWDLNNKILGLSTPLFHFTSVYSFQPAIVSNTAPVSIYLKRNYMTSSIYLTALFSSWQ